MHDPYHRPMPVYHLYWYREALGLTQVQCAQACGINVHTYQNLEQGKSNATPATLRKLSQGLHVAVSRLRREIQP